MVEVTGKENGFGLQSESFFLDRAVAGSGYIYIGLLICWLIATDERVRFLKLYGGCGENGISCSEIASEEDGGIPPLKTVAGIFADKEVLCWHMDCMVDGIPVSFHGHSFGTFVGTSMPEGKNAGIPEILSKVEKATAAC